MITAQVAHEHVSHDPVFVAASIGFALVGSFAALVSSIRIPNARGAGRLRWIAASAIALGGGAIWCMHFMGMLGYHVASRQIEYDIPLTALSLVLAIGVSALGLAIVGKNPGSPARLLFSGVLAGAGVAAMHYTGMAAMRVGSSVHYDPALVGASIAIAVVAATAALWIAFRVRTTAQIAGASVIMAVAVCGMHYTGMAATQVSLTERLLPVNGADPITLTFGVCLIAFTVLALIIFAAFGGLSDETAVTRHDARPVPTGRHSG
ncbi:histidine kinase [Frankia sp. CNm7]|uniref:Histidine kinase n=1 Tax=Frankia nepalensis TaxID=1836974 RepID=A0A937RD12_9ACTN|nr:MHYT domain-containing protein [Frankia nepalensis]MBL7501765.1 histidine kinase [Frankia nepalensis]MBL7513557.1 histidine kinase [Frankia nepalensis]MBL7524146.1 histidine kinase [Frankia nepalensis]MBL7628190.1 histidine kinase [Frankia nepalensis]